MEASSAYLDECVDTRLAARLRGRGVTIVTAHDAAMLGVSDADQLHYATNLDLLLITHDARDFAHLHRAWRAAARAYSGIVTLPVGGLLDRVTLRVAMLLDWVSTFDERRSRLFQWGHLQDELGRGYRLSGFTEPQIWLALGRPS